MTRINQQNHSPRAARAFTSRVLAVLVVGAVMFATHPGHAATTPEQTCEKSRYTAAAKYHACEEKAVGAYRGGLDFSKFLTTISKCHVKYTATWAKLQKKASGTGATCDDVRYDTTVTGTVTDRLTGLQWEQKTDDGVTAHDKDNQYSWAVGIGAADGTVYTTFLATLNSGGCFAGQCDWRVPTRAELQTILLEGYPCTSSPCIDQSVFGPTTASYYWSSAASGSTVWCANFLNGSVDSSLQRNVNTFVRAVRGGL